MHSVSGEYGTGVSGGSGPKAGAAGGEEVIRYMTPVCCSEKHVNSALRKGIFFLTKSVKVSCITFYRPGYEELLNLKI